MTNLQIELSKYSKFLSLNADKINNPAQYQGPSWNQGSIKTDIRLSIDKLAEFCVKHSNIIETENITISSEHQKNTYSILNAFFLPILTEINIDFIAVFGDNDVVADLLKCYFQFYKKFNDIKIEYKSSKENYIMIYDNKPLCLMVDDMYDFTEAGFGSPFSTTTQIIKFQYCRELHNAMRFNLFDNPLKFERKLKIEKLSKNSTK